MKDKARDGEKLIIDFKKEQSELEWERQGKENDTMKLKVVDSIAKEMW